MSAIVGTLPMLGGGVPLPHIAYGKSQLSDGTSYQYATDAEEHLLQLLKDQPDDAYLWNRLGNLYTKGNRPELAVSVFEHSIKVDPKQVESHFTLGEMLAESEDFPNAGHHFRQMLVHAGEYKKMPAEELRDMLAVGLQVLFMLYQRSEGEVPFLPAAEEMKASSGLQETESAKIVDMEMEIFPDDAESFYPFAEMYMGQRAKEIPSRKRTFNVPKVSKAPVRKKKKKRKRRK